MKKAANPAPPPEPIAISVNDFCAAAGISRPTVYRMLNRGDLKSITIGAKRLILMQSFRDLIARQQRGEP